MNCLSLAHSTASSMVLSGKEKSEVIKSVRAVVKHCKPELSDEQFDAAIELAELKRLPSFQPQDAGTFMQRNFPPKEPLIENILYKRDMASLTGRRRHGKTTFVLNLAVAGASGRADYLGYRITRPFTTVLFLLEDDGREIQDKLNRMRREAKIDPARLHLYDRQYFYERGIHINIEDAKFQKLVLAAAEAAKQASGLVDLIVFDNLGMLIGAEYNNPTKIQAMMNLIFQLTQRYDAAVLIAAHPKKGNKLDNAGNSISLRNDPEKFFEETMGSSHFINSTGSLWGIERDRKNGRTDILLGAQRAADTESFTLVEKTDNDWLERVDDLAVALETVVNTKPRKEAWDLLPNDRAFTYLEAKQLVGQATQPGRKPPMKSSGSFNPWFNDLLRVKLIVEVNENGQTKYRKVRLGAAGQSKSGQANGVAAEADRSTADEFFADMDARAPSKPRSRSAAPSLVH